jgi:hypothetical protein
MNDEGATMTSIHLLDDLTAHARRRMIETDHATLTSYIEDLIRADAGLPVGNPPGEDPIIEEVQRAGEAYFAEFDFDLQAIFDDLRRRTELARKAGRKVVSHPPRRPQGWVEPKERGE